MKNKKGQGEQFNWIFVIVSGAIILGFFTMFSFKYITLQESREDLQSMRELGSALDSLQKLSIGDGPTGAAITSNNPGQGIMFGYILNLGYTCTESKSTLNINNPQYSSYDITDNIIFTRTTQQVNRIDLWMIPWQLPFHITNIIYISDPERTYYLVSDQSPKNLQYVKELYDKLDGKAIFNNPKNQNLNKIELNKLTSLKPKSTIIYFTNQEPEIPKNLETENTNFVYINLDNQEVEFYDIKWSEPVKYPSQEIMYGTFFSDNKQQYECTTIQSLQRLKDTTAIYIEKARILEQMTTNCQYQTTISSLRKLTNEDYSQLNDLEEINKPGAGCPWVF